MCFLLNRRPRCRAGFAVLEDLLLSLIGGSFNTTSLILAQYNGVSAPSQHGGALSRENFGFQELLAWRLVLMCSLQLFFCLLTEESVGAWSSAEPQVHTALHAVEDV